MSDNEYIDGIFNYCDRWCERCPFTAHCRTYAMEQEFERAEAEGRDPEDIDWDVFWTRVGLAFDETPSDWLEVEDDGSGFDLGITFRDSDDEAERILEEQTDAHPLVTHAHDYCEATHHWLRTHAEEWADGAAGDSTPRLRPDDLQTGDALEVIAWYHTLIPAKLTRAVGGLLEIERDEDPWSDSLPAADGDEDLASIIRETNAYDAAGSGKVAIISIERSIGAWTAIRTAHPELAESIAPLQRLLGGMRVTADRLFPEARTFQRPGFDDG